MTDLPNSAADGAPTRRVPAGDPELAPLVGRDPADATSADAPAPGEPTDAATADTSPTSESSVEAVPVLPLAAAVTAAKPPAPPRRRRSLALRFGVSFVFGFLLAVGIGAGVMYAWGLQYEGRVLPGVRVGSTDLGGLTREQAEAAIATAYGSFGTGTDHAHRPGRPDDDHRATPTSVADPIPSVLLDAALAAGRQGEPLANLIGAPQAAIHGVTLDPAVLYDRDKLAAAVETLAATIDQTPVDASVSAGQGGTFSCLSREGRSRRGRGGPGDRARPAARGARHAGVDHDGRAGRVIGTRRRHHLGRGGEGGRGTNGGRRGRRPGQGQLDDRRHEPRAADLVLDRGRREHHSGL